MVILTIMCILTEIHSIVLRLKGEQLTEENKTEFFNNHLKYGLFCLIGVGFYGYLLFTEFWHIGVSLFVLSYIYRQLRWTAYFWIDKVLSLFVYGYLLAKILEV